MKNILLTFVGLFCMISIANAADLIRVAPVTDKIIVLVFDDGYIEKHGYHESSDMDQSFLWELDLDRADNPMAYQVSSQDDPNYTSGLNPADLGRKSKAHDISKKCINWLEEPWPGAACKNDYASYHFIYLELPHALVDGKTYTIGLLNLADNLSEYTFTYDVTATLAISVHTNHFGYAPGSQKKFAYISQWMGTMGPLTDDGLIGNRFDLLPLDQNGIPGTSVFNGTVAKQKNFNEADNSRSNETPYSNYVVSNVYECDFSAFTDEGEYILSIEGVGASYPFRIHADAYHEAFYWVMKGLYLERALTDAPAEYGLKWAHPAWEDANFVYTDVRTMDLTDESGNNQKANIFSKFDWDVDLSGIRGWYHDAGDWDGYFSHFRIPRTLMHAYELAPGNFSDGELDIPEAQVEFNGYSGTHIPDILDEAVWLVDYFKHNVGPTGGIFGSRIHPDISTTNNINPEDHPDFIFRDECRIDGIPSWEDCCTWIVHGEDPRDSYAFASIAAQYAYNLGLAEDRTGEEYTEIIAEYVDSAISAYQWAMNNTLPGDESKKEFRENRAAAAAWLYKITGSQEYIDQMKSDLSAKNITSSTTNPGASKWAVWAYATIDGSDPLYAGTFDAALQADLRSVVKKYANLRVTDAIDANRSMRWGGDRSQRVWNGQATTPWVLPAMVAKMTCQDDLDPDAMKYLDACYTTSDYFLGGNQLNMVWMTYAGHEHTQQMLHHDSEYNPAEPGFIPGIPVYGPRPRCDWFAPGPPHPYAGDNCYYNNSHDADFALLDGRLYPAYTNEQNDLTWPVHELYFENYGSPPTNEFTVHQTVAPAAAAYGFLSAGDGNAEPNMEPEVSIAAAVSSVTAGEEISITVSVTDADGWIYRTHLYRNDRLVETVYGEVNDITFKAQESGNFFYRVEVEDNLGLSAVSNDLEIAVSDASSMPSVSITSLKSFGYYRVGNPMNIEAEATGEGITVVFYHFNKKIGEDDTAPYQLNWTPVTTGVADITAVVTDNKGLSDQNMKTVTITEDCLAMQSPADQEQFDPGEYVVARAMPQGCSEAITGVRFHLSPGSSLLDEVASPADGSYGVTFKDLESGDYLLHALAETASGKIISDTIHFTVLAPGNLSGGSAIRAMQVYPNPSYGYFCFDIVTGSDDQEWVLSVFDMTARMVHKHHFTGSQNNHKWEAAGESPGIYSYTMVAGNTLKQGKLVLK